MTETKSIHNRPVALIQLPFPSQTEPNPVFAQYYDSYFRHYQDFFPSYKVNEGDLWEAPLWVAHLDGAIGREDTIFLNLSRSGFSEEVIEQEILNQLSPEYILFFSPLAQNFSFCRELSGRLMKRGYTVVVGGNMSDLADPGDFSIVFTGLALGGIYEELNSAVDGRAGNPVILGKKQKALGYRPNYRYISRSAHVPLVRLNASHGCLFSCSFCGDAWTKQLHLVDKHDLELEIQDILNFFPQTKIIYIGDKTFGQSPEAVKNLLEVIRPEYGFRLIVQTHVAVINENLIAQMKKLGVEVVEIGFETASSEALKKLRKAGGEGLYRKSVQQLKDHGFHVILNVLGGLPYETEQTVNETLEFIETTANDVWLYNIYNFVPYPKTPLFPILKPRIYDWDFSNWREDQPVVYHPYHLTPEQSWEYFLEIVSLTNKIISKSKVLTA